MQGIASNQLNPCDNEKITDLLSFILLLPQKWKATNTLSYSQEKIPNFIVFRYSQILEKLFILSSGDVDYFSKLESFSNSLLESNVLSLSSNKDELINKNGYTCKEFIQNLLCLSTYQSIFNFLMKLISCGSSFSSSFFEKINFTEILLDFLFQKEHFTNKSLFDQTIRLIDALISNTNVESFLFTTLFSKNDKLIDEINNLQSGNKENSFLIFCKTNQMREQRNISYILDFSLYNDSNVGINFILSVQSKVHQSKQRNISFNDINKSENVEKLYRFLEQKIKRNVFDATLYSSILLLTLMMNGIFDKENCIFDILEKTLKSNENNNNKTDIKKAIIENKLEPDYISQALQELHFLDNYKGKGRAENNNNNAFNESYNNMMNTNAPSQTSNKSKIHIQSSAMSFLRIPPPIYDGENTTDGSYDRVQDTCGHLSIYDRNCTSLNDIQEEDRTFPPNPQKIFNSCNQFDFTQYNSNNYRNFSADSINENKSVNNFKKAKTDPDDESNEEDEINCGLNRKRINRTCMKNKDIEEMINYSNSSSNIRPSDQPAHRKQPLLIPQIPIKPNQAKSPSRLRSFASLNNINNTKNNHRNTLSNCSYDRVEVDNNSGYSSNYYKPSISASGSANALQRTGSKNNFTITTGIGSNSTINLNQQQNQQQNSPKRAAHIAKRNSYSFISPVKSLVDISQRDNNNSDDENDSNLIHSSHSTSQYEEDVFPTTIVETVVPEYAKELNIHKNAPAKQTKVTSSSAITPQKSHKIISKDDEIKKDDSDDKIPKLDQMDDLSATPRSLHHHIKGKKRSSFIKSQGNTPIRKRSKKSRTSLPPSNMKITKPSDNNEPLSLMELATSSESLNLDNFSFVLDKDFHYNIHSTSGPISHVLKPEFNSPFRKSQGTIMISNSLSNVLNGNIIKNIDLNENYEEESQNQQQEKQQQFNGDNKIENDDSNENKEISFPTLETISEEVDECHQPSLELCSIAEDDENQPENLEIIDEETNEDQPNQYQTTEGIVEEINEEIEEEKQQSFSQYESKEEQSSQLGTIIEEEQQQFQQLEEQQCPFSQLGTIIQENYRPLQQFCAINEYQDPFLQLGTINEDEENNNHHQYPKLRVINEKPKNELPFPSLGTIIEETEEDQQQVEMIDDEIPEEEEICSQFEEEEEEQQLDSISDETEAKSDSNLFVSIGILLANSLFSENGDEKFQNAICVYLSSLDKCTGMFSKVMMKSNLIRQILNSEKENDKIDVNIPMISKIVNNNHESIPTNLKNEWNEYMKSIFEKEELQTNN